MGDETLGALNVYSQNVRALASEAVSVARQLANQASVVLLNAAAFEPAELTNHQLSEALKTRDLIGQAKGLLMARQDIDAGAAFDILRRASQRTNRRLREIATELLSRVHVEEEQ